VRKMVSKATDLQTLTLVSAMGSADIILEFMDFSNGGERFAYSGEAAGVRERFAGSRFFS